MLGNDIPGNKGPEVLFKHKDIFNKAQNREKKVDWYTQFQESKEKMIQISNGE